MRVQVGKIMKRGPEELRTALVQLEMGLLRQKKKTAGWRLMKQYEEMKRNKGSGKSIVATARKLAVMIWTMLTRDEGFDQAQMTDRKLAAKAESMMEAEEGGTENLVVRASAEEEGEKKDRRPKEGEEPKSKQKSALPRKKTREKLVF
jgi:hypothetical protein